MGAPHTLFTGQWADDFEPPTASFDAAFSSPAAG
jgi:hypothetical protein